MNRKGLLAGFGWAVSAAMVVAIITGDRQAVSLRIWLAVFAAWFALASLSYLLTRVPLSNSRLRPAFTLSAFWHRVLIRVGMRHALAPDSRLREVRSLDALVLRSTMNERAFVQQLRPRLAELADHFLSVNHGIDRTRNPERVDELLGPVSWMLDPHIVDRRPTIDELDTFADVLVPKSLDQTREFHDS